MLERLILSCVLAGASLAWAPAPAATAAPTAPVAPAAPVAAVATAAPVAPAEDAETRLQYIDGLHSRRLHDLLVTEARGFLAEHGDHPRADLVRYRLGSALLDLDRPADAAPHFRELAARPGFAWRAEACLRLGQCELENGRLDPAAAALTDARSAGGEAVLEPATVLLAECRLRQGRAAEALPLFEEALARWPRGEHALAAGTGRAWSCLRLARHADAVAAAAALLAPDLDANLARELRFVQGEALLATGRHAEADAAYVQVAEGPFADAALRGRGFAASARGDARGAAERFGELLARHPDSRFVAEAGFQLGVQRLLAGDAAGARKALAAPGLPASAELRYWQARAAAKLDRVDEALAHLTQADALAPAAELAAHVQALRGDLLARSGRGAEAADAYAAAGSPAALHAAAVTRLNTGDAAGAWALLERLPAASADAALRLTRGEALFALGRHGEAAPEFQAALAGAEPAAATRARSRLAWCAQLSGDLAGAARSFLSLATEQPDAPEADEALFMAGRCQADGGDLPAALGTWRTYLQRHPEGTHAVEARLALARELPPAERLAHLQAVVEGDGPAEARASAALQLGDALAELGRPTEAAAAYQRVLSVYGTSASAPAARYGLAFLQSEGGDPRAALATLAPLLAAPSAPSAPAANAANAANAAPTAPTASGASAVTSTTAASTTTSAELRLAAHELAAWCQIRAGDAARAERALGAWAALGPSADRLLATARALAALHVEAGAVPKAVALLDGLVATLPAARLEAAWIALDGGLLDAAEARATAALAAAASDASAAECLFFVAEARFAAADDARAVPLYDAVAAAGGELADEALYKAGFARLRSGDAAGAKTSFGTLLADHPKSSLAHEARYLAGEAAFQLGAWDEAAALLAPLLAEAPAHEVAPKARFRLGLALAQLERWREAADVLADLARRTPDFPNLLEAELWRGRALAALGNGRGAQAALERVIAEDRGVLAARARLELGQLHRQAGDAEAALSEFLKVALLHGDGEEACAALLHAGDVLAALSRPTAARDRWQELLTRCPASPLAEQARKRLAGQ